MTTREHDFHVLSCVLFGGSCVPLVEVVVLFTCTFLVSPGVSCVRFWWCCSPVKDSSTNLWTDHISRNSNHWRLAGPHFQLLDIRIVGSICQRSHYRGSLNCKVQKHGPGHGRDAVSQAVAPGATPSEGGQMASNTSAARYEVLVPNPDKLPKKDATKEPTYRLRKAMKLV